MKQTLFNVLGMIFKIIASGMLSFAAYWYVVGFVHVEVYAYLMGVNKRDLWAGDSLGLLFQAIPIVIFEFIVFYWFLNFIQKKLQRKNK